MRIACVYSAGLALQAALLENPQLKDRPLIIGSSRFDDASVLEASAEALESGVKIGMPLRRAHALCPAATFLPEDENRCRVIFEKVMEKLDGFSPAVEPEGKNCAFLDITGVKNEQKTALKILGGVNDKVRASMGIGSGRFFARAAAFSEKSGAPVIIRPGGEKNFVAPFSVDLLPCSPGTKDRLKLLGIRRVGQLADFSADDLAAQFGAEGRMISGLARGHDGSPLVPRQKVESAAGAVELFPPSVDYLELLAACRAMVYGLLEETRGRGRPCREIILRLSHEPAPEEFRLIFKEPTFSGTVIIDRLRACLENISPASPVTGVELHLVLGSEAGRNIGLWDIAREDMVRVGEKLKGRFGYQPLKRIEVVDAGAIFPERRTRLVEMGEE